MKIRLIRAKTILNKSRLPGNGYTLNPYLGCIHGCVYCYNQHFIQRLRPNDNWGQFVDIKINAPEILAKEINKKQPDSVFLSTVTDPYQSLEQKYRITHKCLKILIDNSWPISILTKSNLILNDLDLLREERSKVEVGFTIATLDDQIARIIEPNASPPSKRVETLLIFKQARVKTYAFVGPILPELTDLPAIFLTLRDKVDEIWLDTLNTKSLNWQGLKRTIQKYWPKLLPIYERLFFREKRSYENQLRQQIQDLSQKYQIPIQICF